MSLIDLLRKEKACSKRGRELKVYLLGDWERLGSEHVSLVCLAASSLCLKPVDSSALLHMVSFRTSFEGSVRDCLPGCRTMNFIRI